MVVWWNPLEMGFELDVLARCELERSGEEGED